MNGFGTEFTAPTILGPRSEAGAVRSWTNNNRSPCVSSAGRFKIEAKATNTQTQKAKAYDNLAKRALPVMSSCVLESSQSSAGLRSWQIWRKTVSPQICCPKSQIVATEPTLKNSHYTAHRAVVRSVSSTLFYILLYSALLCFSLLYFA